MRSGALIGIDFNEVAVARRLASSSRSRRTNKPCWTIEESEVPTLLDVSLFMEPGRRSQCRVGHDCVTNRRIGPKRGYPVIASPTHPVSSVAIAFRTRR